LHSFKNVNVKTNVWLEPVSKSKRKREIDVLLTTSVLGYQVKFAFECKNYTKKVGVGKISEFVDKLNDVGLSPRYAFYVTRNGYTKDAIERSKEVGIKALVLSGLEEDGCSSKIIAAMQSIIFVLCRIKSWNIRVNKKQYDDVYSPLFSKEGISLGLLPDIVWYTWQKGYPPLKLGDYQLNLFKDFEIYQIINDDKIKLEYINVQLEIFGLVLSVPGKANVHSLFSTDNVQPEKLQMKANFDLENAISLLTFSNEQSLDDYLNNQNDLTLTIGRIKLPRIDIGHCYWPPSPTAIDKISKIGNDYLSGKIKEKPFFNRIDVEGTDINRIVDDIDKSWVDYFNSNLKQIYSQMKLDFS